MLRSGPASTAGSSLAAASLDVCPPVRGAHVLRSRQIVALLSDEDDRMRLRRLLRP